MIKILPVICEVPLLRGSPNNIDSENKQSAFFPMISSNAFKSSNNPVKKTYPEAPIRNC